MSLKKGTSAKLVTLTRNMIVKALKTENLKAGTWVTSKNKKVCGVCAVGSVVRQLGFKSKKIGKVCDTIVTNCVTDSHDSYKANREIQRELDDGNYLNALSMKFEHMAGSLAEILGIDYTDSNELTIKQIEILRQPLIDWVKAEFPDTVGRFKVVKEVDKFDALNRKVERYELERA